MADQDPGSDGSIDRRLQPIIARLREIERKCRALGPRNDEAREMADRIDGVIQELTRAGEPSTPGYAELARRLFPVARLFESLGFLSVAKEVAHVDRLLTAMEPAAEPTRTAAAGSIPSSARLEPPAGDAAMPHEAAEAPAASIEGVRRRLPPAIAVAVAVLVIAVVAAVVLVVRSAPEPPERPAPAAVGTPTTPADDSPRPGDAPTSAGARDARPSVPRSRLADLIGEARLAYQADKLDEAISLLSAAGSIDPTATSVLETADALASELIARSDAAAEAAQWQVATDHLERARELAVRFDLPIRPIDEAARRHGRLVQYQRLSPDDRTSLEAVIGRRVVVLTEGSPVEGTLRAVGAGDLRVELGLEIGNDGALIHTIEVPLRLVREVRVLP